MIRITGGIKFCDPVGDSLAVQVQLPLRWNTYLLINTDTVSLVWKTGESVNEAGVVGWGRKSYLGPAEI